KLLSRHPPLEFDDSASTETLATSKNIIDALDSILNEGTEDDFVFFYYSGHGIRLPTLWPKIKGADSFDEALIPCDIRCGGSYIRDVYLGWKMSLLEQKGMHVTAVLDSCFSGGAFRNDDGSDYVEKSVLICRPLKDNQSHDETVPQIESSYLDSLAQLLDQKLDIHSNVDLTTNWVDNNSNCDFIAA